MKFLKRKKVILDYPNNIMIRRAFLNCCISIIVAPFDGHANYKAVFLTKKDIDKGYYTISWNNYTITVPIQSEPITKKDCDDLTTNHFTHSPNDSWWNINYENRAYQFIYNNQIYNQLIISYHIHKTYY